MDNLMGRYRNVSILAAAIFLQIVALAVQVKRPAENKSSRLIRVWAVGTVTPFEKAIVRLETGTSYVWHNYFYLRGVRQQNRELQAEIQQLELEQVRLRQDAEQARRLQVLLRFKEQFIDQTVAAQVIGASGSEQSRIVYLDKGSADGLMQDMAVISADGIVGKVIQVFRHTAQVLLINDQTSGVGTILEQSRLQGVLRGRASGELVLDNIMAEEDVKLGERLLTSGGDQIFPKGLPVGTIASVRRGGEFLSVKVRPAAALNHLEEVLVITSRQTREPAVASTASVRAADVLAERLPSVPDKPQPGPSGAAQGTTDRKAPSTSVPPGSSVQAGAGGNQGKPQTSVPSQENQSSSASQATTPRTAAAARSKPVGGAPADNPTGLAGTPAPSAVKPGKPAVLPAAKPDATRTQVAPQPATSGDVPQ